MPDHLTEEQLAFFSAQTERAVRKALRGHTRRSLAGFLILLVGIGAVQWTDTNRNEDSRAAIVKGGRAVAVDGCNRDFATVQSLRDILESSRDFQKGELEAGRISQQRFDSAANYYRSQLLRLPLPNCRTAWTVVSDDPTKNVRIPTPRYPGDRG